MTVLESKTIVVEGVTFHVEIEHDTDVRPERDYECFTAEEIQAWNDNEWHFVGLEATPVVDGVAITTATSFGGTYIFGSLPGDMRWWDLDRALESAIPDYGADWVAKLKEVAPDLAKALGRL